MVQKEYKVVFSPEGADIDNLVTEHLNSGWKLYGNPWTHQEVGADVVHIYQSMTREVSVLIDFEDEEAPAE